MHGWTGPRPLIGSIALAVLAVLAGCGVADDGTDLTGTTPGPRTRAPKSLCERVPLDVVEAAVQLDLDPGTPSEALGHPQCHWRESGKGQVVTLDLHTDGQSVEDHRESLEVQTLDLVDVPGLGDTAFWVPLLSRLTVFTGEGRFEVELYNYDLQEVEAKEGSIVVLRTVIETTSVPDTTTTTASTAPGEPEGLCRRFSVETVEAAVDKVVEPGVFSQRSGGGAPSCTFRAVTEGPAVVIGLVELGTMDSTDLLEYEDVDELGVPARLLMITAELYAETDEGLLNIRLELRPDTGAQVRAGLIALAEEFLATG